MINVDFLRVDNAKLVGRILPFYLRGRRIALFILACLSPLVSCHKRFMSWALENWIAVHITCQKKSIIWYLNYKFKQYYANPNDSFHIEFGIIGKHNLLFRNVDYHQILEWTGPIYFNEESNQIDEMVIYGKDEVVERTGVAYITVPRAVYTNSFSEQRYFNEINNVLHKYMINFRKYNIIMPA